MFTWIFARLEEPSTWAGLALFATSAENLVQTGVINTQTVLAAIGGFLATIMSENKGS